MSGGSHFKRRGRVRKIVGFNMKSSGPSIFKGRGLHNRQLGLCSGMDHRFWALRRMVEWGSRGELKEWGWTTVCILGLDWD